jgi:hypothetical protein
MLSLVIKRTSGVKRTFDPTVQTLDLSGQVANVDGLTDLKALQTLNLSSCYHLHNVDGLKNLKALQTLDLSDCMWLANVDGLKGLTALVSLNFFEGVPCAEERGCAGGLQGLGSAHFEGLLAVDERGWVGGSQGLADATGGILLVFRTRRSVTVMSCSRNRGGASARSPRSTDCLPSDARRPFSSWCFKSSGNTRCKPLHISTERWNWWKKSRGKGDRSDRNQYHASVLSLKSVTITHFLLYSGDGASDSAARSNRGRSS